MTCRMSLARLVAAMTAVLVGIGTAAAAPHRTPATSSGRRSPKRRHSATQSRPAVHAGSARRKKIADGANAEAVAAGAPSPAGVALDGKIIDPPGTEADPTGPPDQLNLVGVIEAPTRALRLAVFAVNGRMVQGRVGDLVGDRYRVRSFTDQGAELVEVASNTVLAIAPAPTPVETPPAAAATGALRVIGTPENAEIFVDGAYVGTVAEIGLADGLPLETGPHQLDLQAPNHEPAGVAIRISPNRTTTYRVVLTRTQP